MPLSTCTGNAEVNLKASAVRPGTNAVKVPKWVSPMKNTNVAVRLIDFELRMRPPEPMASIRLSPVPVLPPMASGLPSASLKLPETRRAVPASTTWDNAPRKAVAAEVGKTVPQVAINWLLRRPTVASVIIGARDEAQLHDNLGAVGWALTAEQVSMLDTASDVLPPYPYTPYRQQEGFARLAPPMV